MPFEPKTETYKNVSFIGFHISAKLHNHLRLLSVYKGIYLSMIMKDIIKKLLSKNPSSDELIELLAKRAYKEWDSLCIKMNNKKGWKTSKQLNEKWNVFVGKSKENLKLRRIPNDIIDMIITELEKLEIER